MPVFRRTFSEFAASGKPAWLIDASDSSGNLDFVSILKDLI